MARTQFNTVFSVGPDGSITTLHPIRISGVQLPQGFNIKHGMAFGPIDLTQYINQDLEVTIDSDVWVITGIY